MYEWSCVIFAKKPNFHDAGGPDTVVSPWAFLLSYFLFHFYFFRSSSIMLLVYTGRQDTDLMNGHKTCLHFTSLTPGLGFWFCHLEFFYTFSNLLTKLKLGQRTEKSPIKISFQPISSLVRIDNTIQYYCNKRHSFCGKTKTLDTKHTHIMHTVTIIFGV